MRSQSRLHLHIRGRVQGVSFRYYARHRAQVLGLGGWVRNCPDGSVEAVVEGPDDAVEQFVAWAREGPSMAMVERVDVDREEPEGLGEAFRVVG